MSNTKTVSVPHLNATVGYQYVLRRPILPFFTKARVVRHAVILSTLKAWSGLDAPSQNEVAD